MIAIIAAVSVAINIGMGVLLVRAARRLLEFDSIWQQIMPVLFEYAEDLRKMLSLDLLTDNPEVVAFHKRNMRTLTELDNITKAVRSMTPQKSQVRLPRPDME